MQKVNLAVYDFDGTLVPFETQSKIFFYALNYRPWNYVFLPLVIVALLLYKVKIFPEIWMKNIILLFLNKKIIRDFWIKNKYQIFPWVKAQFKADKDKGYKVFVISASPQNILNDIVNSIGSNYFLATPVSKSGYKIIGKNCKGQQKITYINEWAKINKMDIKIVSMFSDSKNDLPLMNLAPNSFWVNKTGKISKYKQAENV